MSAVCGPLRGPTSCVENTDGSVAPRDLLDVTKVVDQVFGKGLGDQDASNREDKAWREQIGRRMDAALDSLSDAATAKMLEVEETFDRDISKLMAEVAGCQQRQEALQREHVKRAKVLDNIAERFNAGASRSAPRQKGNPSWRSPPREIPRAQCPPNNRRYVAAVTADQLAAYQFQHMSAVYPHTFGVHPYLPHPMMQAFTAATSPQFAFAFAQEWAMQAASRQTISLSDCLVKDSGNDKELDGSCTFTIALCKGDADCLALGVGMRGETPALEIMAIHEGGMAEFWSRDCVSYFCQLQQLQVGDLIIAVNGLQSDPDAMLKTCRESQSVQLVIRRDASRLQKRASTPERSEAQSMRKKDSREPSDAGELDSNLTWSSRTVQPTQYSPCSSLFGTPSTRASTPTLMPRSPETKAGSPYTGAATRQEQAVAGVSATRI